MSSRLFAIVLTTEGMEALEPVLKDYFSEGPLGRYLYCKEANPDRSYFHVVTESSAADGSTSEVEIFIPHRFVKVVVSSTDRKHIGFL